MDQIFWWLKIHKSIYHDNSVTCGETQAVAAERSLNLAPIVLTPKSIRCWSVNRFTCLTSISSDTNVSVKFWKPWSLGKFVISSLLTPSQAKITKNRSDNTIFTEQIMLTEFLERERSYYDFKDELNWSQKMRNCRLERSTGVCYICHVWFKTCQNKFS